MGSVEALAAETGRAVADASLSGASSSEAGAYVVTGERPRQMRVIPADTLRRLSTRSDVAGALHTAAHLLLTIAGGGLVLATRGTWWVVPALLVQGMVVVAWFAAMHESVHYGSFKTRWLAEALAFLTGALLLYNAAYFRQFHLAHHRHAQDPARDPELITAPQPMTWRSYLGRASGLKFLLLRVRDIFQVPFGAEKARFIPPAFWPEIRRWGRGLLAFYGLLFVGSLALRTDVLLWVWLIPLVVGMPFLRLYLMAEHTLCPHNDDGFANTRTTLSNPVVRFLMWNLPYHAEHHLFPGIPFHHLPEAHDLLRPRLRHVATGYLQVHAEIMRSFA